MSAIEYELIDRWSNQATKSQIIRPAPLTLLGPYTLTFATPGLTAGVSLVALPAGAVIYDVGVFVTVAFDGTTPMTDVGTFSGNTGLFDQLAGAAVELADPLTGVTDNTGLQTNVDSNSWLAAAVASVGALGGATFRPPEVFVSATSTIKAVISQNGQKGGTAVGSTAGTALVYLLCATPTSS